MHHDLPALRDTAIAEILEHLAFSLYDRSLELAQTHAAERYECAMESAVTIFKTIGDDGSGQIHTTLTNVLLGSSMKRATAEKIARIIVQASRYSSYAAT